MPLPDLGRESLQNALRGIGGDTLQGAGGVHVIFGERRMQHYLSTVPRMSARDAVAFVTREGLRLANVQSVDDILVAPSLVRRLSDGKLRLASTALGRGVWEPLRVAFEQSNVKVLSLQSMEASMAFATDRDSYDAVAVLEYNAGRARFVLCVDQAPVQVRRFLIGGGVESNAAAFTTQLAMELPRTFDWLRETGHPVPSRLLLGSRVAIDEESLDMLRGDDLEEICVAPLPVVCAEGQAVPSIGAATLLHRLCIGKAPVSLLDQPKLRLPWHTKHLASLGAAAAVGALCTLSAVVDGKAWLHTAEEHERAARESASTESRLLGEEALLIDPDVPTIDPALEKALKMRRPVSRLISEVSNAAGADVHLEELAFASTSRLTLTGQVEGQGRKQALAAMGRFTRRLHELEFLLANGQEEIGEVRGQSNRFRFKLSLGWRNP